MNKVDGSQAATVKPRKMEVPKFRDKQDIKRCLEKFEGVAKLNGYDPNTSDTYWWAMWLHLLPWPSVMNAPTTLRNSTQLARQLDALTCPEDGTFLTMDIVQLYTSIKHEDGLRALAWHIRDSYSPALRGSIMEVMRLCLHHNYFSFAGLSYHQVSGTAMGFI